MSDHTTGQVESELIKRARQGDRAALDGLFDRYYPLVFTYVVCRVSDPAVAEDLAAEVFVRMVDRIDRFDQRDRPLLAWLYTIAHHLVVDYYRSQKSAPVHTLDERVADSTCAPVSVQAETRADQAALARAFAGLTEDQRRVLLMKFVHGCSNAETAQLLDKPETAVKSLQHRALNMLRRLLVKEGFDER